MRETRQHSVASAAAAVVSIPPLGVPAAPPRGQKRGAERPLAREGESASDDGGAGGDAWSDAAGGWGGYGSARGEALSGAGGAAPVKHGVVWADDPEFRTAHSAASLCLSFLDPSVAHIRKYNIKGYHSSTRDDHVVAALFCRGGAWDSIRPDCRELLIDDPVVRRVISEGERAVPSAALEAAKQYTHDKMNARAQRSVRARKSAMVDAMEGMGATTAAADAGRSAAMEGFSRPAVDRKEDPSMAGALVPKSGSGSAAASDAGASWGRYSSAVPFSLGMPLPAAAVVVAPMVVAPAPASSSVPVRPQ